MTTYTFSPKPTTQAVSWDDPTVWSGMVVPNAADADVVFPLVTLPPSTSVYTSSITIKATEAYATRSIIDVDGYLEIDGTLSVSAGLYLGANAKVDLSGGTLTFGSLTSAGYSIQGSGQVSTPGTLTNQQQIIGSGLTVTASSLLNPGSLIAAGTLTITLTGGNAGSDFAGGVLTGGVYQVLQGGSLILNTGAAITAIGATVEVTGSSTPSSAGDIQSYDPAIANTLPLQQTLQTILASGDLVVQGYKYETSHAIADGGTITLQGGALSTPGLTVAVAGQVSGYGTIGGPIRNDGLIEVDTPPGTPGGNLEPKLILTGSITGTGTLVVGPTMFASSATLELAGPDTDTVSFGDGTGTLVLDNPATFAGTIAVAPTIAELYNRTIYNTPGFSNDTVMLVGTAFSSVTGTSFASTATGGVLTLQEGAARQSLTFTGNNLTLASFVLSAGPQALSTTPPTIDIVVTPGPAEPTLTGTGAGTKLIVNTATPTVTGTVGAGSTVTLSSNGMAAGTGTVTYPFGVSSAETYAATLAPGLGSGLQQVVATAANAAGSAISAPLSLDVLPTPVNGVTAAATTSLDVATLLGQGYGFQFVGGTEALQLTNGTLSVGPDTTQALVQRLYEGLLGRAGDTAGLAGFNATLVNGGSPATVASGILASSEYQALPGNPATQTDTQFVTNLYQGFLSRAPDQPGLTGYVNALAQGASRGQAAATFAQSAEAKTSLASSTAQVWVPDPQGALVTELYETGLGRAPDLGGLQAWKQQLSAGLTPLQVAQGIATSAEFNADHAGSSNAAFVTSLYQAGLGRTPAAPELQGWVNQLQAGAGSTNVLYGIATSAEAGSHLLPII